MMELTLAACREVTVYRRHSLLALEQERLTAGTHLGLVLGRLSLSPLQILTSLQIQSPSKLLAEMKEDPRGGMETLAPISHTCTTS